MICQHCGTEFTARDGTKFCKDECRRAAEKIRRRKDRPETECPVCGERFIPSRHGQKNCQSCRKASDDLKLQFARFFRNRDRTLRVLRSNSSRGIPQRGELKLPELPDDWQTSTQPLHHTPGTINPRTVGDLAAEFLRCRKFKKGKLAPQPTIPLPKPTQDWLPVPCPGMGAGPAQVDAWSVKPSRKNRDAIIAARIRAAFRKECHPFHALGGDDSLDDGNELRGTISAVNSPISERELSNDGNETRAKIAAEKEEIYGSGDDESDTDILDEDTSEQYADDGADYDPSDEL
jgi:hypothetical protein